jgi:hypothetical protein
MISDLSVSSRVNCHGLAQHIDKATIMVGAREEEGTEGIGRGCRGGNSGQRNRFRRLSVNHSLQVRENVSPSSVEEPRAGIAMVEKWF